MLVSFTSSASAYRPRDLKSTRSGRHWRHVAGAALRLFAVGLLCAATAGCLPEDENEGRTGESSSEFPVSNLANKEDRWDFAAADESAARPKAAYEVATTATVVPTSAPAEVNAANQTPSPPVIDVPAGKALANFLDALAALDRGERSEPVTIVHLGDERIAADRFTATLRERLQARFGNAGRGLMAPGLFRVADAEIVRKGNWSQASSAAGDPGPFGLAGVRLTGHEGALLELSATQSPFDWAEIMFATERSTGKAHVSVDGKGDTVGTSTMEPTWQRIRINAAGKALKLRVEGGGPVHLLSLAVGRDAPGVRYVNLGVPGATALTPKRWDDDVLAAELKHLSPDLIVIGYGTNEAFDAHLDAREYASEVSGLLARLKSAAPEASLLVIGPPDVAHMPRFAAGRGADACRALSEAERADYARLVRARSPRLGRWHPPMKLRSVRRAMRGAASQTGAYFWDWSEMMGGPCSIHAWAHAQPPLALDSHRHFTPKGARHSAEALFRDLLSGYERHRNNSRAAKSPQ